MTNIATAKLIGTSQKVGRFETMVEPEGGAAVDMVDPVNRAAVDMVEPVNRAAVDDIKRSSIHPSRWFSSIDSGAAPSSRT